MKFKQGRYSGYLRPFLILFDLSVINTLAYYILDFNSTNLYFFSLDFLNNKHLLFIIYSSIMWLLIAFIFKFYSVYRYTSLINIFTLLIKQFFAFSFIVYAFIGIFRSISINAFVILKFILGCLVLIAYMKVVSYYILKKYRVLLNGNIRNVVIIGNNSGAQRLYELIKSKKELGYKLLARFSDASNEYDGNLNDSFSYINNNRVDEVYCAIDELTENQVNEYVKIASKNRINIKFVPETNNFLTKRLETEFYNYLPILSIQEVALNKDINAFLKRLFDIVFSILVIIFVLSWFIPLLFILVKLDSKGPLFYKHYRNGLNYEVFTCYKIRTLKQNTEIENEYVKKGDGRVTKVGRVLRKYSIDELPQFYNVLLGNMSVVGPRPHMESYTKKYSKIIDKYSFIYRHSVKPGLTGLAQVKGYRGEIISKEDIINRIKYDIFYIENWSTFLDLKIIGLTVINIIKGEEKAY